MNQIYIAPAKPTITSINDYKMFLRIVIYMSVVHYPNELYWSQTTVFTKIKETMGLKKFEKICSVIHFNDNSKLETLM